MRVASIEMTHCCIIPPGSALLARLALTESRVGEDKQTNKRCHGSLTGGGVTATVRPLEMSSHLLPSTARHTHLLYLLGRRERGREREKARGVEADWEERAEKQIKSLWLPDMSLPRCEKNGGRQTRENYYKDRGAEKDSR